MQLNTKQTENAYLILQTYHNCPQPPQKQHVIIQGAYLLATAFGECNLIPKAEIRAKSGTRLYRIQARYWDTGFYGRGFVQLTHKDNYKRFSDFLGIDLIGSPDLAIETDTAAKILVYGMVRGMFTGLRLSQYLNDTQKNYIKCRAIVNGSDKAELFAQYALEFEDFVQEWYDLQGIDIH